MRKGKNGKQAEINEVKNEKGEGEKMGDGNKGETKKGCTRREKQEKTGAYFMFLTHLITQVENAPAHLADRDQKPGQRVYMSKSLAGKLLNLFFVLLKLKYDVSKHKSSIFRKIKIFWKEVRETCEKNRMYKS